MYSLHTCTPTFPFLSPQSPPLPSVAPSGHSQVLEIVISIQRLLLLTRMCPSVLLPFPAESVIAKVTVTQQSLLTFVCPQHGHLDLHIFEIRFPVAHIFNY